MNKKIRKRVQNGISTSHVVLSTYVGNNADIFPKILALHVPVGLSVADVTYGKGIFWKNVPQNVYKLLASDISDGVDCRDLPYEDKSIDCVVLDPPYMEGFYRERSKAGRGNYSSFSDYYSSGDECNLTLKGHAAVSDMYFKAGHEAYRILKENGVLIVKC